MMDDDLPKVIRTGAVNVAGLEMTVHVLDNGQRVIDEQSLLNFMEWLRSGRISDETAAEFAKQFQEPI